MSEVFSYSIDAVVTTADEGAQVGQGLVEGIGAATLLSGRALDLLDDLGDRAVNELSAIAARDASIVQSTRTWARVHALQSEIRLAGLATAIQRESPEAWAHVRGLGPSMMAAKSIPRSATDSVERAICAGVARLATEDRTRLVAAVQDAMVDIGYRAFAPVQRGRELVVTGRHAGGTTLVVQLDPSRGRLVGDFVGFAGTACSLDGQKFEARLRARGLDVRRTDRRVHGSPDGGALVRELSATRQGAPDPQQLKQGGPTTRHGGGPSDV